MWISICNQCYSHWLVMSHVSVKFLTKHSRDTPCLWKTAWPLHINSQLPRNTSWHAAVMNASQVTYMLLVVEITGQAAPEMDPTFTLQFTSKTDCTLFLIFWEISTNNSVARDHELCGNSDQWCDIDFDKKDLTFIWKYRRKTLVLFTVCCYVSFSVPEEVDL